MRSTIPASAPSAEAPGAGLRAAEFPGLDGVTYLNSASIGPLPARTIATLERFNRQRGAPHLLPDPDLFAIFAESRRLLATLVNASPEEIALSTNTSYGLNLAALSLPLEAGDVIVASDREFPANVYPWLHLARRGIRLELAPVTPEGWPDERYLLERIQDPQVKVLAVSLVQFSNGYAVDLDALSRETRRTGTWLVVDAIQGLGQVPVDLRRTPVDILSCGGQKWLLAPWGSGFTYVRRELIEALVPPLAGWMAFEGTDDFSQLTRYRTELRADARRFEVITLPFQDFAGLNASVGLILEQEPARIGAHARACHGPVVEWAERRGVRITSPRGPRSSAILCVAPPKAAAAYARLREAGIYCSLREGSLRLSPHLFNTVDELAQVADILEKTGGTA
ncbi:MAG TPA: aminotransferase class V-fold PLP-dependent enzyme [Gemmatimonadales bacterium]